MDAPSDVAGWVVLTLIGFATVAAHVFLILSRTSRLSRELVRGLVGSAFVLVMAVGSTVGYQFIGGPWILVGVIAPFAILAICMVVHLVASELGDVLFERISKGKS